jgi:hypothetical protein
VDADFHPARMLLLSFEDGANVLSIHENKHAPLTLQVHPKVVCIEARDFRSPRKPHFHSSSRLSSIMRFPGYRGRIVDFDSEASDRNDERMTKDNVIRHSLIQ